MKKFITTLLIITMIVSNNIFVFSSSNEGVDSTPTTNPIYDLSGCFGCIYIDTKTDEVTVDGNKTTLCEALDITEEKSKKLLDSEKKLEKFCYNHGYTMEKNDDVLTITNPYQTKRILVYSNSVENTYGATSTSFYNDAYILQYNSEEDTANAYEYLINDYGSSNVILDEVINIYSSWQDKCTTEAFYQYLPNIRTNMYPIIEAINDYDGEKRELVVGVIDTGIDTDTPIYSDRYLFDYCTSFISDEGLEEGDPEDTDGHGTAVAFTLANSSPDNVKIIMYKVFDADGNTSISVVRNAILAAEQDGVDIINMSFGGSVFGNGWNKELKALYDAGVDLIAAAGNEGTKTVDYTYPASSKYTIAVSSISNTKSSGKYTLSDFSSYGNSITFSAPGENLALMWNDTDIYYCSGTSFSSPLLAGQLATLKTFIDTSSVSEDINLLKEFISSDFDEDYASNSNYKSSKYGYGYLDFIDTTVCTCGANDCCILLHSDKYHLFAVESTTEETTIEETTSVETTTVETSSEETTSEEITTENTTTEEITSEELTHAETTNNNTTTEYINSIETTNDIENLSVTVKRPKKVRLKIKKKSITVKFKKRNSADKVIVYYSKSKNFTKYKTVITKKKRIKFKIKKSGVYYVRLRSFRIVDGVKYYSKYTKTKRIKL